MRSASAFLVAAWLGSSLAAAGVPLERWVYAPVNHLVPKEIDRLEALMRRAKPLGYTHFLLADSKFARLGQMEQRYYDNLDRVKRTAGELRLQLVPAVFPVGYSNDILWHDPNLAEGLPVREALFVVKNGEALIEADPPVSVPALSERKKWGFIDDTLKSEGDGVRLTDGGGANARCMVKLKVAPFRHYHASMRVKTDGFHGRPEIKVLAGEGKSLVYTYLKVKPTQDWTTHHVTFNSLDNPEINLYFGVWSAGKGSLWMADPMIEEAGPVNLLRRDGCPLVVKTEDGKGLREGIDFGIVSDPKMGNQPYAGEFEVWHDAPPIRTKRPDGTRLRVSYYHPHIVYDEQVCGCVSEPKFMDLLHAQARDMSKAWGAGSYMMSHDEWRVLGWDEASLRRKLTPGQIVADNARQCVDFLREAAPAARVCVWSDMFDPHHNAVKNYYLVNGDLTGAWDGLDKRVIIMNWNFGKRAESLKFFADRGHAQILSGYYDAGPDQINDWLAAAKDLPGVIGVMYTTWERNYSDLEAFAKNVEAWEQVKR